MPYNTTEITNFPNEEWKEVTFDFEYVNSLKIYISNYGRVKSESKLSSGRLLKGSLQDGYPIIRLKLFSERDKATEEKLQRYRTDIAALNKKISATLKELNSCQNERREGQLKRVITLEEKVLATLKKKYKKELAEGERRRTKNTAFLVHRMVATHFCHRPSQEHSVVIHQDFNKRNNRHTNLKWVTPAESVVHQQKSPAVIADKAQRLGRRAEHSKGYKLTVTRVMILKKRLQEGKPLRLLAKQFKVTETQIKRIQSGENWADVPAAT
jgi:hypothetical protein